MRGEVAVAAAGTARRSRGAAVAGGGVTSPSTYVQWPISVQYYPGSTSGEECVDYHKTSKVLYIGRLMLASKILQSVCSQEEGGECNYTS